MRTPSNRSRQAFTEYVEARRVPLCLSPVNSQNKPGPHFTPCIPDTTWQQPQSSRTVRVHRCVPPHRSGLHLSGQFTAYLTLAPHASASRSRSEESTVMRSRDITGCRREPEEGCCCWRVAVLESSSGVWARFEPTKKKRKAEKVDMIFASKGDLTGTGQVHIRS
ncbi:hypothetical protein INR49_025865 [Caranx melampygus]|nr:hypothetical protein INR49_025865 [Caranx melampygus]